MAAKGRAEAATKGRIVAVANLKGGTGKSTLAVNLACLAARAHAPVLLVDADPQGTAAAWLEPGELPNGLEVEAWPVADDPASWTDRIVAAADRHARIVIDLPPQLGPGIEAAFGLVDALVIPVTPSAIDLRATAKTLRLLERVRRAREGRPACLLVPNRVDQRTAVGRTIQRALRDLDLDVAPPIAQRSSHAMAFAARRWIGAYAPGSPALRETAAVAARLDALLAAAPANDSKASSDLRLSREQVIPRDDLDATDALRPMGEAAARRRAVDASPPPAYLTRECHRKGGQHNGRAKGEDDARKGQRRGWLASLFAGIRILGRPHSS